MERRTYSREFKLEAVNLVQERGVAIVQAARDLDLNHNVLRGWVRELGSDPKHAFPGLGQMKPEQLEIDHLRKEVVRLKAERDILKKAAAYFARDAIRSSHLSRGTGASGPSRRCFVTTTGQRDGVGLQNAGYLDLGLS